MWTLAEGAYADYVASPESFTGLKPKNLPHAQAGTIPEVGLTSLFSLKRTGSKPGTPMPVGTPWPGKKNLTVVITAGSGGTGFVGIELAKAYGMLLIILPHAFCLCVRESLRVFVRESVCVRVRERARERTVIAAALKGRGVVRAISEPPSRATCN